jgi:hypothetical protein
MVTFSARPTSSLTIVPASPAPPAKITAKKPGKILDTDFGTSIRMPASFILPVMFQMS